MTNAIRVSNTPVLLLTTYEMGRQPFNLASPMAVLSAAGIAVQGVDTAVSTLPKETIRQAWFVGISVPMHTATRLALSLLDRIQALNPAAYVCFYGLYATLNADYLLARGADFIIGGEYEAPLRDLILALRDGRPAEEVAGVTTRHRHAPPHRAKIPFLPPRRETLPPLARYARLAHNGRRVLAGYTEASRGCLHTCRHCPITPVYGGRFFVVPQDVVLADIAAQVEMGARHITFGDPDFLNGPGHSLKIVRAMHRAFPHLTFDATIKVEHILKYPHHMAELKSLGCLFVVSAIESFSDTVLAKLKKGHTRADIAAALSLLADIELPLRPSLVAFTPWTTMEDYLDMLAQVEALGLVDQIDPVQYSIRLLVPPHSALTALPDAASWIGPLHADRLTHHWAHPDPRMDDLHPRVAALVAAAAGVEEDAPTTFRRLKRLAQVWSGQRSPEESDSPAGHLPPLPPIPTPRLTENWFC